MNGEILDLRDYDRVEFAPCKGLFLLGKYNAPKIIHTRVIAVNGFGKIETFYLFDTIDDELNNITLAVSGDMALNYYSMFWLRAYLNCSFGDGYLFADSDVASCSEIEEVVLPLIHHGVAVSSEVLDFIEKPITLELLRETFPDEDLTWNKTESEP